MYHRNGGNFFGYYIQMRTGQFIYDAHAASWELNLKLKKSKRELDSGHLPLLWTQKAVKLQAGRGLLEIKGLAYGKIKFAGKSTAQIAGEVHSGGWLGCDRFVCNGAFKAAF